MSSQSQSWRLLDITAGKPSIQMKTPGGHIERQSRSKWPLCQCPLRCCLSQGRGVPPGSEVHTAPNIPPQNTACCRLPQGICSLRGEFHTGWAAAGSQQGTSGGGGGSISLTVVASAQRTFGWLCHVRSAPWWQKERVTIAAVALLTPRGPFSERLLS